MTALLAIPLLPLLAAVTALAAGRRLPWGGGELVVAGVALSLVALALVPTGATMTVSWFESGDYRLTVGLAATPLTRFVAMVVAGVAVCVATYGVGYMGGRPDRPRFFAELGLFVGAMLALVLANSLALLFAAWEMVGLASFLLIGFEHAAPGAAGAASKAFLMTRAGDVGLLLGWLLALAATGTTDVDALAGAVEAGRVAPGAVTAMALLMLAGALGKSAQLPFSAWLPDAMVGPTPVSALLHSATMVAAGVFLVLRLDAVFAAAPLAMAALFWVGAVTAVFAALVATAEADLKRVLAWSTCSQLGEMMVALGLGGARAAAFHLAVHAAFKSTLFLAAGIVQERAGTRALDRLGGFLRALPLAGAAFLVAALALAGVPPLSGFWSEEGILAVASQHGPGAGALVVLLVLLGGTYIGRAGTAAFLGRRRDRAGTGKTAWTMRAGTLALALAAAVLGWLLAGSLGALLPFEADPGAEVSLRNLGIAAGLLGLGIGVARGRGGSPALGPWPARLAAGLSAATAAPARWTTQLARRLGPLEDALDAAARRVAGWTWGAGEAAGRIEVRGFARLGDGLAAWLAAGGERLRALQAGRLYLYTLGLFAWATAALAAGALLLWP
ncbi:MULTISPECIES: proton-conducting transporter membrane subunit [Methylobacterium]|jgi:NADH-quinone oxidoreductase subunit L|uniref:NADH-quinone oxidoreductase subunit M n=4 Tax=Methylobacterium TaxID=407 RepID=A0A2R4WRY4_9HYPH|nr:MULTISPECIES: proton-conducting transporter membrane subunit [Methylobacterium]MBZ6412640.1 NADH-quinone oxidoreductase subunit L [Methylobacterium sp.]AWB24287.1 NADH-quinone oxidoreductase subunit M [Methylobacterium currus]MBK3398464.1 NADH-quinone oxidoreductase subunit L [Methylobacterium ajmalii]MBK3407664.1 NADH-quinone oxidoreductase subunit L [Methylobacterium ajmalii]NGM33727.1 NADH-quinone oxidoreductase subunit L [Methylobacterium sp. DB0501]